MGRSKLLVAAAIAAAAASSACGGKGDARNEPYVAVADVKAVMTSIMEPAADIIWASVGTVMTKDGTQEIEPKTDEDWSRIRDAALTVAESGNLLMMPTRLRDNDEWIRLSRALVEQGGRAARAATEKNKDAVFTVGGDIYSLCTNCHAKYKVEIVRGPK